MLNISNIKKNGQLEEVINGFIDVPNHLKEIMKLSTEKKVEVILRQVKLNNLIFTLIDVKLPRFKEESLYDNKKIHSLVPRGLCFVFADCTFVHKLYGHPKFGNYGDFKHGFKEKDVCRKLFRKKENGECGHLGSFKYNNELYFVVM